VGVPRKLITMIGTTTQLKSTDPTNAGSSQTSLGIRQSILTWSYNNSLESSYADVKGVTKGRNGEYLLTCNVFSGIIPPTPELGEISDIYIDTDAKRVYVKTKQRVWKSWVLGKPIPHPLGIACNLYHQVNLGITWMTSDAFKSHQSNHPEVTQMDVNAAIKQTLAYHRYLDPTNWEGADKVGRPQEVHAQDEKMSVKTEVPLQPLPPPLAAPSVTPYGPIPLSDRMIADPSSIGDLFDKDITMLNAHQEFDSSDMDVCSDEDKVLDEASDQTSPLTAQPSYLASRIPLFKHLLQKPKVWLALAGRQFPSSAKIIEWANGVCTVLPWQKCHESLGGNPVSFISTIISFFADMPYRTLTPSNTCHRPQM
jgi:hypothetical protein